MAEPGPVIDGGASRAVPFSAVPTLLMSGLAIAALYFGREILVPIALAVLLSFLLAPAVRLLRHWRVGRVTAVMATVLLAFIAIVGFGGIVAAEVASLAQNLPEYQRNIDAKVQSLHRLLPSAGLLARTAAVFREVDSELAERQSRTLPATSRHAAANAPAKAAPPPLPVEIRQPESAPLAVVESVIGPLLQPLATAALVVVFVILILLKREDLRDRMLRLAGARDLHRTTEAMNDAAQRVSRYLLMQLVVNAIYGVPVGIGLAVIGIPNAALWGMLAVLLRFIPYFGIVIAAAFPLALAVAVDPGWSLVGWTALLFVATETVVANVVEPWLYGASTGLSSVAVIVAATFWTWLWGPIGLLLSTPLTVCVVVLGRYVPQLQFLDVLLGNQPVLAPEETFYQRLLANDPEEATEQAEEFAKEHSLAAFFDEVAIPALAMAQTDSDRGAMTVEHRSRVVEGFSTMLENLTEDAVAEAPSGAAAPPLVAVIAGRNELDRAAASLLTYLLQQHGHAARVFAEEALATEPRHYAAFKDAAVACLSLVSTGSPARARYLVRRLRRRVPRGRLMVGFWGQPAGSLALGEATIATSADLVVTSLRDAVADIDAALRGAADISSPPAALEGPQILAAEPA